MIEEYERRALLAEQPGLPPPPPPSLVNCFHLFSFLLRRLVLGFFRSDFLAVLTVEGKGEERGWLMEKMAFSLSLLNVRYLSIKCQYV